MTTNTAANQSAIASHRLFDRAVWCGIKVEIIATAKPRRRTAGSSGETAAPQKCLILNDIRMSLGEAEQYIKEQQSRSTLRIQKSGAIGQLKIAADSERDAFDAWQETPDSEVLETRHLLAAMQVCWHVQVAIKLGAL